MLYRMCDYLRQFCAPCVGGLCVMKRTVRILALVGLVLAAYLQVMPDCHGA